jgi:hypothetical protein
MVAPGECTEGMQAVLDLCTDDVAPSEYRGGM